MMAVYLAALVVFAGLLFVGFVLGRVLKAIEATGDRYFSAQRAFESMKYEANKAAEKLDQLMVNFTYPPADPVLPPMLEETQPEPKAKRKRGR